MQVLALHHRSGWGDRAMAWPLLGPRVANPQAASHRQVQKMRILESVVELLRSFLLNAGRGLLAQGEAPSTELFAVAVPCSRPSVPRFRPRPNPLLQHYLTRRCP